MAIAAMLNTIYGDFVESDVGDRLMREEYELEGRVSRSDSLSLGEQQHFMSLASWHAFQLQLAWIYGCGYQEENVPKVVEEVSVGEC
jgi:hypothetical protein